MHLAAKIKSIKEIESGNTHDIEVNHKDHQFYLANGVLTSNSHSIAYSHISYYTAWLRCNYPTQFMCALLNSEDPNSDKSLEYINECSNMGIVITPPNVNTSKGNYVITGEKEIATGLSAIKGVGQKAIDEIISLQPFSSLEDFFYRTNARVVNKRVMEAMAKCGAFSCFNRKRKDIFDNFAKYRAKVSLEIKKEKKLEDIILPTYNEEWNRKDFLMAEREALGRVISGSLHEVFEGFFTRGSNVTPLRKIASIDSGERVKIEVIINSKIKEFKIKNGKNVGKKFAKYLIEDAQGSTAELTVWQSDYEIYNSVLIDGTPIRAICKVDEYMEQKGLSLTTLEKALGK